MITTHKSNVIIGAGRVYLDRYDGNGKLTGERYLGDSPGASLSVATERSETFSADGPVAVKLVDIVRSITRSWSVTVFDISAENLALFFAGEAGERTQSATAVADEALTVNKGRYYQLGASAAIPLGVGAIDAAPAKTVVKTKTGSTTYAVETDYQVEPESGRLFIVPGGAIANGAELKVSYTPVAGTRETVRTGKPKQIQAAIRYIEDAANPESKGRDYYARLCSVGASGELALKNDRGSEQQIQLTARRFRSRATAGPRLAWTGRRLNPRSFQKRST